MNNLGARVYGLAAINMGIAGLLWGDFALGWMTVPATLPGRMALAYLVGALLVAGGLAINWRRASAWGAALLMVLFAVGFAFADLPRLASHASVFVYYEASAEQLALTAGGLIAYASSASIGPELSSRLAFAGRFAFGLCLLIFGTAHFVYAGYTAAMVPKWLPPTQMFWTYFTGIAAFAAGLALLSDVLALLAMRLLTVMYILFGILVHARILLADPTKHESWQEHAVNLALAGAAWIVADSLAARKRDSMS
jgi:uncharacterized membrane protein